METLATRPLDFYQVLLAKPATVGLLFLCTMRFKGCKFPYWSPFMVQPQMAGARSSWGGVLGLSRFLVRSAFDTEHRMDRDTERTAFKPVLAFSLTQGLETVGSLSRSFIVI